MGYSLAWVAARTSDPSTLFAEARFRPTDQPDEYFQSPISGAALDGGWFLLVAQGCDHRVIDRGLLKALSARWECVACSIQEHVMYCSAAFWRGGVEVWSASHDGQEGIFNLVVDGYLPDSFEELRENMFREQESEGGQSAEVDVIFEIPLLLAKQVTGFKHDEDPTCLAQSAPVAFVDESPQARKKKRRWLKLW